MTEEEAKKRWCPFARVTNLRGTEPASNRYEDENATHPNDGWGIQPGSHCIGSACMAWQIGGYCGLAGKP